LTTTLYKEKDISQIGEEKEKKRTKNVGLNRKRKSAKPEFVGTIPS
jgi:hypothetical protein